MKKLFSKEIIFITPLILILSFFLFTSNVNATTTSCSLPDSYFDFTSDYSELKTYVDSYMQQHNSSYYIIVWYYNLSRLDAFIYSTLPTYNIGVFGGSNYFNLYSGTSVDISYKKVLGESVLVSSNTNLGYVTFTCGASSDPNTSYFIIDTNINFTYTNTGYEWAYTSNYGDFTISNGTNLPSLIDYNTPIPPDNTPILTDFFTLTIDKLGVISDYFSNNVYLYFIPLIPILILCIYFIKRSLIK